MTIRRLRVALCLLGLLGCGRFSHRSAPDASSSVSLDAASTSTAAATTSATPDDEEEGAASDGGTCPLAVQPGYCRRFCKTFTSREQSRHAKRIAHSARVGLGKCGAFDVFAEDEQAGDAGVQSGIVEFFGKDGALVGAIDTRSKPCGEFGQIPKCKPVIAWEESRSLSVRQGAITVTGRLPPEVIQRIVRQNFGRFRLCYLNSKQPTQEGRVVTKFVIATDGTVSSAQDAGSDLPYKDVTACVVRSFSGLNFPQPEGGPVTVTYPIVFSH